MGNIYIEVKVTLYFAMSQNGQIHFKNLAANAARFLKCVWPFYNIAKYRVKPEAHSEPGQRSKMELFAKIVNGFEFRALRASSISRLFLEFSVRLIFQDSSGKFSYLWCSDFRKMHFWVKKLTRLFYLYPTTKYLPQVITITHQPEEN